MFKKVKNIMNSSELIKDIDDRLENTRKESIELRKEVTNLSSEVLKTKATLNKHLEEIKKQHELFMGYLRTNAQKIEEFQGTIQGQITDFKLQKKKIQELVYEKASKEINQELERLRLDVGRYNELKEDINNTSVVLNELKDEVSRFKEIAKKVSNQDFELVKFTNKVASIENEKMQLIRKIDTLQKLISRERRTRR
ncbi:hypothetical protein KY330_02305 [Candidatus Woesearchaeota archaeon]|nr:hypothetical protein [Candidatus Woesearchaeota archaeon]